MKPAPIVVVGAGQAAASFISRWTALGNKQPVILIGEEPHPPYQRPPLSKKYLLGELARERLFIRPPEWYVEQAIETRLNTRVESINRKQKKVITRNGETIDYDRLILATGSSARRLPAHLGGELKSVYSLRSFADIDAMEKEFQRGRKLLIVGGGYIGLEAAAVGRILGLEVTILEMADRILQRVAAKPTSDYFRALHHSHGVDLRESTGLARLIERDGVLVGAELASGEIIEADLVLVGIGGYANTELAEAAGIECDNGIAVDGSCQTSDADIYAAGDCCSFLRNGRRIRLESVQNASDQGDLIARVLSGEDLRYSALPWFWSDQYDCKLQIVGLNQGHNQTVLRQSSNNEGGDSSSLSVWYYDNDKLLAIDAMNDAKAYAFGRKIIEAGKHPSPAEVADPNTDLKAIAKS
ncbi:MAG: 3-phenylpropionate/trans-cinnamate dioxygenase ferredoxin reductase subunit [Planctomycetota bacterium]|jgi:3-phenylpropionate/trans-cinnamate dioxygenase ferredoxin reductase subunit